MEDELFDTYTKKHLDSLLNSGRRKLTLKDRSEYILSEIKDNIWAVVFWLVILVGAIYTLVTLNMYTSDYNSITKVDACTQLEGVEVPPVLPDQTVTIENTCNKLGANSDCWVRVKSGSEEFAAVTSIAEVVDKKYPKATSGPGMWRNIKAYEFNFESNFYEGNVTVYRTKPAGDELTSTQNEVQKTIAEAVGKN
jgi:hypothetical protein